MGEDREKKESKEPGTPTVKVARLAARTTAQILRKDDKGERKT